MLKYTLGALAAMIILIGAAFAIIAQVTGGGADAGPARMIIISAVDQVVWPPEIQVEPGEIIDLRFQNHTDLSRTLQLEDAAVEQFPEAPAGDGHDAPPAAPSNGVSVVAPPGQADAAYVRFNEPGEYALSVLFTGQLYPPDVITIIVR